MTKISKNIIGNGNPHAISPKSAVMRISPAKIFPKSRNAKVNGLVTNSRISTNIEIIPTKDNSCSKNLCFFFNKPAIT